MLETNNKVIRVAAYCRVSTDKTDQRIRLKASRNILTNTLSEILCGNCITFMSMTEFQAQILKNEPHLIR